MADWMVDEARGNIGLNYLDKGDYAKAIEYYNTEIDADPDAPQLYFWRGRAYREAALTLKRNNNRVNTPDSDKYFDKSIADYQKARELFLANENVR